MKKITAHFSDNEFQCPHCLHNKIQTAFVQHLEELYGVLDKAIGIKAVYVNSGYRCSVHSIAVGGLTNDAHVLGFAADIHVLDKAGSRIPSKAIAEAAELLGFNGIGIITDTDCHVDDRGRFAYKNSHWFGNESTGITYPTFKDSNKYSAAIQQAVRLQNNTKKTIKISCTIDDKKYSGLLEEE